MEVTDLASRSMSYEDLAGGALLTRDLGDHICVEADFSEESKPLVAAEQSELMRLVHHVDRPVGIPEEEHVLCEGGGSQPC